MRYSLLAAAAMATILLVDGACIQGVDVNPGEAFADPIEGANPPSSIAQVNLTAQKTGTHIPVTETVTRNSAQETGGSTSSLTVSPTVTGGEWVAKVSPPADDPTDDWYEAQCDSTSTGVGGTGGYLKGRLRVVFPATTGKTYTVKWKNESIHLQWEGNIILPTLASSAHARLYPWTSKPWADGATEAALAPIGVTGNNRWEHNIAGPAAYTIEEAATVTLANLEASMDIVATAENIQNNALAHECNIKFKVRLIHGAAVEGSGSHESRTTTWTASNWVLTVSVTTP